jgi:hypothetical protein
MTVANIKIDSRSGLASDNRLACSRSPETWLERGKFEKAKKSSMFQYMRRATGTPIPPTD